MVEVVNLLKCPDWGKEGDIYIGRGSSWGNPFVMRDCSDEERNRVIDLFVAYFYRVKLDITPLLKAKRLGCYCKPKACHDTSHSSSPLFFP